MRAKIAEFKSRMSHYLRHVKMGQEVIITERDTPIAKVLPFGTHRESNKLIIIRAKKPSDHIFKVKIKPIKTKIDALRILQEDREDRF